MNAKNFLKLICVLITLNCIETFSQSFNLKNYQPGSKILTICNCELKVSEEYQGIIELKSMYRNYGLNFNVLHELENSTDELNSIIKYAEIVYEDPKRYIKNKEVYKEVYIDKATNANISISNLWKKVDDNYYDVILKTPFNPYIDKTKNFDIMFLIFEKNLKIILKNYFTASEKNSIGSIYIFINNDKYIINSGSCNYGGEYLGYKELEIYETSNSIWPIAYRTVSIHDFNPTYTEKEFEEIMKKETQNEMYSDSSICKRLDKTIKNCIPGKVYISIETSTGEIKRQLNESQTISLKEMIQIYKHEKYNKYVGRYEKIYENIEIENKCKNIDLEIDKMVETQMNKIKLYEDSLQKIRNKFIEDKENVHYKEYNVKTIREYRYLTDTLPGNLYTKISVYKIKTSKNSETNNELIELQKQIKNTIDSNYKIVKILYSIDEDYNNYKKYLLYNNKDTIKYNFVINAKKLYNVEKENIINKLYYFKSKSKLDNFEKNNVLVINKRPTLEELKRYSDLIDSGDIVSIRFNYSEYNGEIINPIENTKKYINELKLFFQNSSESYIKLHNALNSIKNYYN